MKTGKKKRLEAAGWQIGSASQLLGLSKQEAELVELRLALAKGLRLRREAQRLTQARLAKLIGSSQSRVAKMEAADSSKGLHGNEIEAFENQTNVYLSQAIAYESFLKR